MVKQIQAVTGRNEAIIGWRNLRIARSKVQRSPTTAVLSEQIRINRAGSLPSEGCLLSRRIAIITNSSDATKGSGIASMTIPLRYQCPVLSGVVTLFYLCPPLS
jgi:hypothetical protein